MPKVSVIVTTYNRKEYLTETIQSILNQTYQDFELIVVDNFSNYDFFALIESFKSEKIIPLQNQNNGIIAVNRNVGINYAKGEYIAFCDDDDIWIKNKLNIQMKIVKETNCDLLSSNMLYFDENITKITGKSKNKKIRNLKDLITKNQINTSTVLVKNTKELFFKEDRNLIAIEDYALWLDLFIKGISFEFINQPLVFYRVGQHNINKKNWDIINLKMIYLYKSILIYNPNIPIKLQIIREIVFNYMKFAIKYILKKWFIARMRT